LTVNSNTAVGDVSCKEYNPVMDVTDPYKARNFTETSWTERIVWLRAPAQKWKMKSLDETSDLSRDKVIPAPIPRAAADSQLENPIGPQDTPIPESSARSERRAGDVKTNLKDGLRYVWIPPGKFTMWCSPGDGECNTDERPAQPAEVAKGLWLGQTEVTVAAWRRYVKAVGGEMPPAPFFNEGWLNERQPIVNISWNDAQSYCRWAGMRLPSEVEWEYAARAGSTAARYGEPGRISWYFVNSAYAAHDVGTKEANTWGLFDMLGNAEEWVADWYIFSTQREPNNLRQALEMAEAAEKEARNTRPQRALRGGSWHDISGNVRASVQQRLT